MTQSNIAQVTVRQAAIAGWLGVGILGGAITGLSFAQYAFMRELGWHPLHAPTYDWPSGLALGPYGWIMSGAFIFSGIALMVFARGLREALRPHGRLAGWLITGSGYALILLASPTDPTKYTVTPTLAGMLHDAAFVVLGVSFFAGIITTVLAMRHDFQWRWLLVAAVFVAILIVPAFVIKGFWFYIFLASVLSWVAAVAYCLWKLAH
jgi:Protein of unknown function (DUF998)